MTVFSSMYINLVLLKCAASDLREDLPEDMVSRDEAHFYHSCLTR